MAEFLREKSPTFLPKGCPGFLALLIKFQPNRLFWSLLAFLLFASPAMAQVQINNVIVSDNNPQVGETVAVTVDWCDDTEFNSPYFLGALSTASTLQGCASSTDFQNYFADANGVSNVNNAGTTVGGYSYSTANAAGVTDWRAAPTGKRFGT